MKRTNSFRMGRRRGVAIIYIAIMAIALLAVASLGVDVGHVQVVKTQLQLAAEAAARAGVDNLSSGSSTASAKAVAAAAANTADGTSVALSSSTDVIVGTWNFTTNSFTSGGSSPNAVEVFARRTKATNNAVSLTFAPIIGQATCDVTVSTIAALYTTTVNVNVSGMSNPYFAGMPAGTTNAFGDETTDEGATQVSIPVVPGTYLTFSTFTGTSTVVDGTTPYFGPDGATATSEYPTEAAIQHGQSYDGTYPLGGGGYTENGIANAIMAEDTLMGLFLTNNAPNTQTASSTVVDWTQSSQNNQASYTNIALQQPFAIGDGVTTSGTVQKFMVPAGATRFYVGAWDGVEYNNNGGSLSGSVTSSITQIVK